ncbi:MAG: HI1506-related protein [Pseudomonadota bacterium]
MAEDKKAKAAAAPEKEQAKAAAEVKVDKLVVRSLSAGFRRAGRAWPAEEVTVNADEFTAEQIEQLLAEPMLVVLPVAAE